MVGSAPLLLLGRRSARRGANLVEAVIVLCVVSLVAVALYQLL
jgi:hypothetical protein